MCTHGPDVTLRNSAVRRREETCCSRHACVRTLTAPSSSLTVCRMLCCSSSSMSSRCSCACDSLPSSEAAAASCRGYGQHQRVADDRACPGTHERWRQHTPRAPRAAERGRVGATACVQRLVDKRRSPGLRNDYSITCAHGPAAVSNKATGAEYQAAMLPVRSAPTRTHPSQPPHELPRTRG